jgi:toxin ParE1/3/4
MVKPLRLHLTPAASADLEAIWLYTFETWSIAQADRYIDALNASFQVLCDVPEIARDRTEFSPPVRIHPTGRHLIVYQLSDDALTVIRVLGNRQNWQAILGDGD